MCFQDGKYTLRTLETRTHNFWLQERINLTLALCISAYLWKNRNGSIHSTSALSIPHHRCFWGDSPNFKQFVKYNHSTRFFILILKVTLWLRFDTCPYRHQITSAAHSVVSVYDDLARIAIQHSVVGAEARCQSTSFRRFFGVPLTQLHVRNVHSDHLRARNTHLGVFKHRDQLLGITEVRLPPTVHFI